MIQNDDLSDLRAVWYVTHADGTTEDIVLEHGNVVEDSTGTVGQVLFERKAAQAGRGYVIERFTGELVGPFFTREEAEPYLNPGDEIVVVGEHGHVIDYGPQFDDESEPARTFLYGQRVQKMMGVGQSRGGQYTEGWNGLMSVLTREGDDV